MPLLRTHLGRSGAGALIAGAGFALLLGFAPLPVGGQRAVDALSRQLEERTGLAASAAPSDVRLTLLPFPKVRIANLSIAGRNGEALARISAADAYLRPLDLVAGRLRFNGYSLQRPVFDVSTAATRRAWRAAGGALVDAGRRSPAPAIASLSIADGVALTGPEPLTEIAASVAWAGGDAPLSIWARGRWRGEEATVRLSDLQPGPYFAGRTGGAIRINATSPFATLTIEGAIDGGAAPRIDGDARLSVSSAARLGRWLDIHMPLAGALERYTAEGRAVITERGFASPAATLAVNGARADGALALRLGGERPQLVGTLAAQAIDFELLAGAVDPLREKSGAWSQDAFALQPLRRMDLDLRLSAARVKLFGASLKDAAFSMVLNAGRLEFALGQARAYEGSVRGRASLFALDDDTVEARLQANFDNVDAGAVAQDLFGRRSLAGRGNIQTQLEASGRTPAEIARRVSGRFATQLRDGEIAGVSLVDAARKIDRMGDGAIETGRGRTPFATLDLNAAVANGVADLLDAAIGGGGFAARATGSVSIAEQNLRIDGRARATGLPNDGLPFTLRGPLHQPQLRWDLAHAFKRS